MATVLERPRFIERIATTTRYTVKSGIPIPPPAHGRHEGGELKYPFEHMLVGDCFDVPVASETRRNGPVTPAYLQSRISVAARYFNKRVPHAKFSSRTIENGTIVRVWRTA